MHKLYYFIKDTKTMSLRCLQLSKRNLDTILTSILVPALMMLLFTYVLGGAMVVKETSYVNYIVPAILLQCCGQCVSCSAVRVNNDLHQGILHRFCTLPISKSSILIGHIVESVCRNFIAISVVLIVAYAVGFRPNANGVEWLVILAIILLYIITISWLSVLFGILANSAEGATSFSILTIILPYVSSGFVPLETLPTFLRGFAQYQPITLIVESLRSLMLGNGLDSSMTLHAMLWCVGIALIAYVICITLFNIKTTK